MRSKLPRRNSRKCLPNIWLSFISFNPSKPALFSRCTELSRSNSRSLFVNTFYLMICSNRQFAVMFFLYSRKASFSFF